MNKPILKFALAILLLPLFSGSVMAEERDAPEVFVQFLPEKGEYAGVPLMTELKREGHLPIGEYRVKAHITLATEKVSEVFDSRALEWGEPARRIEGAPGWLKRDGAWIWTPSIKSAPLGLPFAAVRNGNDDEVNLADFDELWLDTAEVVPGESCPVSVAMTVAEKSVTTTQKRGDIRKLRLLSGPSETLLPLLSIDPIGANWRPKDNVYLAKRVLGLGFDEDWRYIQDGKNAVIQRRFHQDLQNVEALDLLFATGAVAERVNVVVSWKDHLRPDETIDWGAIPKQIERTAEGTRVRLHLGDVVSARLAAQKREGPAFLAELVIFIPGEAEKIAAQRALRALVFQSMPNAGVKSVDTLHLPQRSETVAPGHRRLVVDLRPLAEKKWRGAGFEKGILTLYPRDPVQYCGIKPASLRLVTLGEGRRPVVVGDILRFDRSLGGPFLTSPSAGSPAEWIEADSYLPFSLLAVQSQAIESGGQELKFASWGLTLQVGSASRAMIEKKSDGLALTGAGGEVKLLWDHSVKLDEESRLILKIQQGAKQISAARVEIDLDNGEKFFVGFDANQAALLGSHERAGKTIRRITIHLKIKEGPFKFILRELLLFHPRLIEPDLMLDVPRPELEFVPLIAADAKAPDHALLTATGNRVYGVLFPGDRSVSWNTPVHLPAGALVALQFGHRLSAATDEPCWLTVTLNGTGGSVTRQLCPEGMQGKLIEPLAQLLGDLPPDEMVRSISWKVQLSSSERQATSFDFQAHLGTVHAPSMADLLQNHALFRIGQHPYRPVALADEALEDLAQRGSAWLDLGTFGWEGGKLPLQLVGNHPYFRVTRVNLESSTAPTEEQWARLSGKDKHGDSPWPRRLAMFGLLLLVAVWARLRRDSLRRLRERGLSWTRAAWPPCRNILTEVAGWVWHAVLRLKRWVNRAMGVFMLVPGLWLLGRMRDTPLTRDMVGFALVLAAGALWHELRWRYSSQMRSTGSVAWWFGGSARVPEFVLLLTVAAMGWAAWSLGRGETYGALLPLVAVGYYYLPWLALAVRWIKTGNGATWAWALVTLAFYFLGLLYGVGSGENYFFTIGGLAAVLAWRAWMMSIRTRFETRWLTVAQRVYGGAGTIYFTGALVGLILTALFLIPKWEFLAEQVAVVVYYLLVVGTVLEIFALRRESRRGASEEKKPTTEDAAG